MRMHSKLIAAFTTAALIVSALGACGGGSGEGGNTAEGSSGAVISYYASEPQNPLIPGNTNETGGGHVIQMIFAGLVGYDKDGNTKNEVAKSIEASDGNTKFDITLNDDWKFTDGTAVTAESFTKAWSYTANATNAQKCASFFSNIKGYDDLQDGKADSDAQLEGLTVVSDTEFTVELSSASSVFPQMLGYAAFSPLPESFYDDPDAFGENPVGDGPYKFESWEHNQEIKVVKNDDYHGNFVAQNGGIDFKIYTSTDTAYSDVQAGNLDVLDTVPSSATATFEEDTTVQSYNKAGSVFQSFTFPSDLKHFANDEEGHLRRQAISMSIDRDAICSKVRGGTCTPAVDFLSPKTPGYSDSLEGADVLKYNPDKAKELWAQADKISQWTDDDKLQFSYNADGDHQPIYDAIVNSVKNTLGINAVTNPFPTFSEFRQAVSNRSVGGAFRTGWQPDYPSAENYLVQLYSSSAADGNGSNDGDYKNTEFDDLLDKALAAETEDEANEYYQQAEEILLNDLPAVPLFYSNAVGVASTQVQNFEMDWQNMPVLYQITKSE